jgi:OOP family OmpA-OmpF porin
MKKILLLVCASILMSTAFSQTTSYKKQPSLGIHFIFNDFKTPQLIKANSLSSVINNKQFSKLKEMDPGFMITYGQGITDHVDFVASFGGSFVKYPLKNRPAETTERFLAELDANVNVKLLNDSYVVNPYLTAGAGVSYYKVHYGAYIPVGAGFQVRLSENDFIKLQAQYRIGITELASNHLNFSLGFTTAIIDAKPAPAPKVIPPPDVDTDGDGILDSRDQCPTVAGVAKYNGCPVPDTDNDGLKDDVDQCPTVPGLAKYNGCPIPDTDGDKINDEEDKCPTVAGVQRYQGCPVPDTDGDGVNDDNDKCPNEAGPASNGGCPEKVAPPVEEVKKVQEAAKRIYFETGSAKLKATSTPALNSVVAIMKKNSDATITIEGHTDNVGTKALNQKLSEDRAASVQKALVSRGIDASRIKSVGYGFDQPIAPNTTAAGRAKNRRVVMTLE